MIAVGVFVTLRVAEVYQVQLVRMDSKSNCCILWLNILVDNGVGVNGLQPIGHLLNNLQWWLDWQGASTEVNKVRDTRTQTLHRQISLSGILSKKSNFWNAIHMLLIQIPEQLGLVPQPRVRLLSRLNLQNTLFSLKRIAGSVYLSMAARGYQP